MVTWVKLIYIRRLYKLAKRLDKKVGRRNYYDTAAGNLVHSKKTF